MNAQDNLFGEGKRKGLRVVITGQVGIDKSPFLEQLKKLAESRGKAVTLCHVGDMMYAEAPDVIPGRILDLPRARLDSLRRSVFKDIISTCQRDENVIINTHATFRWNHGLFPAYDQDHMEAIDADLYITLVDNVDSVHERLSREHQVRHTLKDILVWREEEMVVTKCMARSIRGHGCSYIFARGVEGENIEGLYRLLFEPHRKRVYPSFPMTHVMDLPDVQAEIDTFRAAIADHFIAFDPGDLDEKRLLYYAAQATQEGKEDFELEVHGRALRLEAHEVSKIAADIDGQIYARDFELVDQSDMIVSLVPELPGGKPGLSSGVERELQHAFEATKEVYVVWMPKTEPSPFITETATKVFSSVQECLEHFQKKGYIGDFQMSLPSSEAVGTPRERGRFGQAPGVMEAWSALPETALLPELPLCAALRRRGLPDLRAAAGFICELPYGRTTRRHDYRLVLDEGRGTCSTKHALLTAVASELGVAVQLTVGIYAMSEANTPGVGAVLAEAGLAAIPEAHCYVIHDGRRIDITRRDGQASSATRYDPEWPITPEQVGEHKIALHRRHLLNWLRGNLQVMLGLDDLWAVREACIEALCRRRGAPST